jgi:uncharacterized protein YoxC
MQTLALWFIAFLLAGLCFFLGDALRKMEKNLDEIKRLLEERWGEEQ